MAQEIVGSDEPSLASDQLKPRKAGYGQNGYGGASSDVPGEKTTSTLADELKRSSDDGEGVLDRVIAGGISKNDSLDNFQERPGDATQMQTAWGNKNPNANPSQVPARTASNESEPVRKPARPV